VTDAHNLLGGPPAPMLPVDPAAQLAATDPHAAARAYPSSSLAWALLAEQELARNEPDADLAAYAYARTGYHRGLDALRRSGWKGFGPIPWEHVPNRGFLRALAALAHAAGRIDDADEATRCSEFLRDSSALAAGELGFA
jgi:Protein of unknown function (DUF3151)